MGEYGMKKSQVMKWQIVWIKDDKWLMKKIAFFIGGSKNGDPQWLDGRKNMENPHL